MFYLLAETDGVRLAGGHLGVGLVLEDDLARGEAWVDLFGEGAAADVFFLYAVVLGVVAF